MKKVIYLVAAFFIVSCYNSKKAQKQFGKAAATYPEIPASYCAVTYPTMTTIIGGDTVTITDTVKLEGNIITDTIITFDTVRITTTKTLPGQTISVTKTVHDTIQVENTAKLKVCELDRSRALDLLSSANMKADKFESRAKARLWIMISFILAFLISLYFNLRKLFS